MNKKFPHDIVWQETLGSFHLIQRLGLLDQLKNYQGFGVEPVGFISEIHPTHILVCGHIPGHDTTLISIDRNSDDQELPRYLLENWILNKPASLAA